MTATEADIREPGTEIDLRRPQAQPSAIPAKLQYARALAESGLLPGPYRKQPANILWAVEYGDMLGLSTMAAITGVHVIEGKPTASAGLISALVRRAGHKLRVHGNSKSATCQIIRSDDPGHVFEVTWTLRKNADDNPSAEEAKLLAKDVWQKYPASMLKSRAITQCARDACEEALFGLHYTAEELGANVDEDGVVIGEVADEQDDPPAGGQAAAAAQFLRAADAATTDEAVGRIARAADAARTGGRINRDQADRIQHRLRLRIEALRNAATPVDVEDLARAAQDSLADGDEPGSATTPQIGAIWTVLSTVFKFTKDEKDQARAVCAHITGHPLESTKHMSRNEAKAVLDALANWREVAERHEEQPREFLIELLATAQKEGEGDG